MEIRSGDRPWPRRLDPEGVDWPSEQRVLVPFHEAANLTETGFLGASVTFGTDGELYVLHAVGDDDSVGTAETREHAELKREIRERFDVPVTQRTERYSRSLLDSFVESHSITTTVVDSEESAFFPVGDDRPVPADCHTVVGTGMAAFDSPSSILVPVAKGPHSGLATRVAAAIASAYDCWIELFHVVPADASAAAERDAEDLLAAYDDRVPDGVDVDLHVVRGDDVADVIVEHADYHDATVLGAPEKGTLRRFLFGSTTDAVTREAGATPVLTAHRKTDGSVTDRWI